MAHVAGHPALDFIGTLSERGSSAVEELPTTDALQHWWLEADVVDGPPATTAADLEHARAVREAMYRALRSMTEGKAVDSADAALLNETAGGRPLEIGLSGDGTVRRSGDLSQCLSTLVRSFFDLVHHEPLGHIRWCADDRCTHPFLDTSRAQARRWCDMATCGARHKQRALRARRSHEAQDVADPS